MGENKVLRVDWIKARNKKENDEGVFVVYCTDTRYKRAPSETDVIVMKINILTMDCWIDLNCNIEVFFICVKTIIVKLDINIMDMH